MPELPEVEAARKLVEIHCCGKMIQAATVLDDDKVIEGISHKELQTALQGREIVRACRKGKHLWLELDEGPALMLHFGMTGSLVVKGVAAARYKTFVVDEEEWPPRFWKVQLDLEGGVQLAFSDARRFARVRLQPDPLNNPPISKLGFDLLNDLPPVEELQALLSKGARNIKTLLLDQAFAAGVGNWVADELLYQARIHPEQRASTLDAGQVKALHRSMHEVPAAAVAADANSENFPKDWIFHIRWDGQKKGTPELGGNPVSFATVGGRTTAFVPAVQKLPKGAEKRADKPKAAKKRKAEAEGDEGDEAGEAAPAQPKGSKAAKKHGKAKAAEQKDGIPTEGGKATAAAKGKGGGGKKEAGKGKKAAPAPQDKAPAGKQKVPAGKQMVPAGKQKGARGKAAPAGKPKGGVSKRKGK